MPSTLCSQSACQAPLEEEPARKAPGEEEEAATRAGSDSSEACASEDETETQSQATLESAEGQARGRELLALLSPTSAATAPAPQQRPKLSSNAAPFVPQAPQAREDVVCQTIRRTFGHSVGEVTATKEETWTSVHVKLGAQMRYWQAMQSLLAALSGLGPKVTSMTPSEDCTWLKLAYLHADPSKVCWEFVRRGKCPRPSCRWTHAPVETFVVKLQIEQPADLSPEMQQWFGPQCLFDAQHLVPPCVAIPWPQCFPGACAPVSLVALGAAGLEHHEAAGPFGPQAKAGTRSEPAEPVGADAEGLPGQGAEAGEPEPVPTDRAGPQAAAASEVEGRAPSGCSPQAPGRERPARRLWADLVDECEPDD